MMKKYTLITGASQGMGKQMAVECAMRGRNVLLVSLPNENLENIADNIAKEYNIETDYFECDLTLIESAENIYNWTKNNNYAVDFLINNAGFGGAGPFEDYSYEYVNRMLDLNIRATTNLTHYYIPELKKNAPSYILNSASMIANFPCPYKTIYAATKVYVKSFTRALREELKPYNISVSVLQPGATPTNKVVRNQIASGGFFFKISVTNVEQVAKKAINRTLKGQAVIVPGFKNRLSLRAIKLLPMSLVQYIVARSAKNMKSDD
jgi:hypothetical protein